MGSLNDFPGDGGRRTNDIAGTLRPAICQSPTAVITILATAVILANDWRIVPGSFNNGTSGLSKAQIQRTNLTHELNTLIQNTEMIAEIFIFIGIVLVFALNVESSKTVTSSQIHSEQEKRKFKIIIWVLPVIGTMIAMWLINKDIRKKQHQMEEEIAPAIKELGDRLKKLESGIQRKQNKNKLH